MKLTVAIILILSAQLSARPLLGQTVSLSMQKTSLIKVFEAITQQTGFHFIYFRENLEKASPVTINVNNVTIDQALRECLRDEPLTYELRPDDKQIVISQKSGPPTKSTSNAAPSGPPVIEGVIRDEKGLPAVGASVTLKNTSIGIITDKDGRFVLRNVPQGKYVLQATFIGYTKSERGVNLQDQPIDLEISLRPAPPNSLDETVIMAYGTTSHRLNTGDIATVSGQEIEEQPVANLLGALEGRVPGLLITQQNGLPGSFFNVQLHGQSSIGLQPGTLPMTNPLIIVDGVPFAPNNNLVSNTSESALGTSGISPLIGINPMDIQNVEVLKDADATAIYGSRGANGVILITTKRARQGGTVFQANVYTGVSHIPATMPLMNTRQYVAMRTEALNNDGVAIDQNSAPDLTLLDTTSYTDYKKMFIGNNANTTDAQASISGGTPTTQFLISGGYHHETTVFPTPLGENRGSAHVSFSQNSSDQRFKLSFNSLFSVDVNHLPGQDLTQGMLLEPNIGPLKDPTGTLLWSNNGVTFNNPISFLSQPYTANTTSSSSNLQLSYLVLTGLTARVSAGYSSTDLRELSLQPAASQAPGYTALHIQGDNLFKGWIIEPQLEYNRHILGGKLNLLAGATFEDNENDNFNAEARGYSSDALLSTLEAATSVTASYDNTLYKYSAGFARLNYNWQDKYLLTLSGRRDGSSRFGPGRQFGNFGSAALAWIFTNEKWGKFFDPILSFGKLRASYGTTGNDQIGDYIYYNTYSPIRFVRPYGSIAGIQPTRLFNPDFQWEINKKLEAAIDLGFAKDRINFSLIYYDNRSGNQLVQYTLPTQTGFGSLGAKNFPAVVENSGFEATLLTKNISTRTFTWMTRITLTIPRNKLVSFPGLATSPYSNALIIGKSLSEGKSYVFNGVNDTTGVYQFLSANGKSTYSPALTDLSDAGNHDPKYYGGFYNSFTFKGWQLDLFFEGRKQLGLSYLQAIYINNSPGFTDSYNWNNEPTALLARWQKPGDQSSIQQFTGTYGSNASNAIQYYEASNAANTDASFIKLRNLSLAYSLPAGIVKKARLTGLKFYVRGENLFTITKYKGTDPESQSPFALPPLRTFTAGIQFNL